MTATLLKLAFNMRGGKVYTLSISDPKSGLTRAEALTVMNQAINDDIIDYNGAEALSVNDAYTVQTTKTPLV